MITVTIVNEDNILTVNGRCKVFINSSEVRNNHYDIVIGKGANVNIQVEQGDINMNALDGRINMNCAEDFNIICGGEFNIISQGDFTVNSGDDITLQGDKIFLNFRFYCPFSSLSHKFNCIFFFVTKIN